MKKILILLLACIAAAGCASAPQIDTSYKSASQDSRVQYLVIHFTSTDFPISLKTLTQDPVSSHYLVRDDPPTVYRLVDESRRAYHAGVSSWKGQTQLNAASIGIEIVNLGLKPSGEWDEYPKAQIDVVIKLIKDIVARHEIRPDHIVGHNDIAPQRKVDPGPKFPWKRLADEGIIPWPDAAAVSRRRAEFELHLPDVEWFQQNLAKHGFAVPLNGELDLATRNVLIAFQMKYRPARFDGTPDAETAALLDVLVNPPAPAFAAALDAELAAIASDAKYPLASLSVLAIRDGEIAYQRQFGRRFIDEAAPGRDKPVNQDTLYRIASVSKLVTTLGAMKLVEQGKLSLDADIGGYLGYRVRNPHFPEVPITLRMLLTHTSSLRDDAGYFWLEPGRDLKEILTPGGALHGGGAMWSDKAKPGTYFSYANLPWGVAGTIMEKATGERFDRLMKRLIVDPMGLRGGYNPAELPAARIANVATLYRKATAGDTQVWNPQGPWIAQADDYSREAPVSRARDDYVIGSNGTLFSPQGGFRATAADLGRIMRMLMNGGALDGRRVLKPETVDAMLALQWRHDGGGNGDSGYGNSKGVFNAWGLGNQHFLDISGPAFGDRLVEGGGFTAIGHHGDAYGLSAAFVFDRATKNGMIMLAGGTGFDPETDRGAYSAAPRYEERILTALYRRAIQGNAD
jgi:N-acetyl-anhydromuramyl-L-alanine amidase AmpD